MNHPTNYQLIETLRAEGRQVPLLELHLSRARQSALALGYNWPEAAIRTALDHEFQRLPATATHRIRLLCAADGTFQVQIFPLPPTVTPVSIRLCSQRLNSSSWWLQHKTTCRPEYNAAQQWLSKHTDIFDLIFCNEHEHVCEGSRTTLYIQDERGQWLTPPLSCGLLPGVQRRWLLEQSLAREALISLNDLRSAKSLRVSNALRGWLDARLTHPDMVNLSE